MTYKIIKEVCLKRKENINLKTKHYVEANLVSNIGRLQIINYIGDNGFYLLYLDDMGEEITDTYHENIEEALSQAKWEFGVTRDDWVDVE